MGKHLVVAAAVCVLTLLSYFQFPGHTYLQSDSQIYVPILEHLWDPTALANDIVVQKPHVSFTLYDETAEALRKVTGLPFRRVLAAEQVVFRALGIWGLFLIASSSGLSTGASLLVTAIVSLGATIFGPAVLTFEYEPTPRAFAVPLVLLATGLTAHGRYLGGAMAGSAAFLLQAPTTYPFWIAYAILALRRRKLQGFAVLLGAVVVLWIESRTQAGSTQSVTFFARIDAGQEALQRMRASYNWVSVWARQWLPQYIFLYAITLLGVARLRKALTPELRSFATWLPLIGMLSLPVSYLTLEKMKWALIPQIQPMRALLFVTLTAALLAAIAACLAVRENRYWEAAPWLALAYLIPVNNRVLELPSRNRILVIVALTGLALVAIWAETGRRNWAAPAMAVAAVAAFFVIPICGKVSNYPRLQDTALEELCRWAASSTPKSAVFVFPDAKQELSPGIFRAEALRAVYVDWKAGGQVNFFKDFGEEWWSRWRDVMVKPVEAGDRTRFASLGISFVVLRAGDKKLAGRSPVFENSRFAVFATGD